MEKEHGVAPAGTSLVATSSQSLSRVLTHCFEEAVPDLVTSWLRHDQRLVQQTSEQVQHCRRRVSGFVSVGRTRQAHRLRRLEGPAAGEYRELLEYHPFGRTQQCVAPVDCRPDRLLANWGGPAAIRQQPEVIVEPCGDLVNTEQAHSRRCQL